MRRGNIDRTLFGGLMILLAAGSAAELVRGADWQVTVLLLVAAAAFATIAFLPPRFVYRSDRVEARRRRAAAEREAEARAEEDRQRRRGREQGRGEHT